MTRYRTVGVTLAVLPVALAVRWLTPLSAVGATVVTLPVVVAGAVLVLDAGPPLRRFCHRSGVAPAVWAGAWLLVAAGIGAANWLGDPVAFCAGRRCITGYAWASVAFVGGAFALAIAAGNWPLYRRVTATAIEGAGDRSPGPVAVSGTVEPAGETVRAPVTGRAAVCCRWAIAERTAVPPERWTTVETGESCVPFYVSDATGRVLVDPEGADVRPTVHLTAAAGYPVDDSTVVGAGESLPESVRTFEADRGPDGPPGPPAVDRQYQETRIEPADPVFVVGEAVETRRVEYPDRVVVAGRDGAPPPAVFAGSPADVRGALRWRVAAGAAVGLVVGVPGLVATLAIAAG